MTAMHDDRSVRMAVDPLLPLRQRLHAESIILSIAVLGMFAWAFWPARSHTPELLTAADLTPPSNAASPSLVVDWSAFDAPIWNPTPPPPSMAAATPPPPLRLQLLAITAERDAAGRVTYLAAIYDPDADSVRFVREGESIANRRVRTVTSKGVEIADAAGPRTLSLDFEVPPGGTRP